MINKIVNEKLGVSEEMLGYYKNKVLVIKFGGSIMHSEKSKEEFIDDILYLKSHGIKLVLVHGGGQFISKRLENLGIKTRFLGGYRVTDKEAVKEVEMVLSEINKSLTMHLNNKGIKAIGLNGKDGGMIQAEKMILEKSIDLGSVGEIRKIDLSLLKTLLNEEYLPVIAPIAYDFYGNTYNVNADDVAGKLTRELKADRLIMMTDVNGLYEVYGDDNTFIKNLSIKKASYYITSGKFNGGIIPKIKSCIDAVTDNSSKAHIINGCTSHGLIMALLNEEKIGTIIKGE